ncbi:hypothetical protein WQ54_22465 [Bacillus sp. SA1-12]|uniref:hypothetical protein n=1 Tax=Bacillus sp. SA1-12 TaxID=1455638 RepID=UPI0006270E4E|nr:hypothetical protein [Bacillus sp. SA1-12]KKI89911.1 hypothetical protein WQ54_22465 [Bacillus sp. SA1-12]
MSKGLIFFGAMLIAGFGTNFLIRMLRDGDFYIAEFITSMVGVSIILIALFLKKSNKSSDKSY